VGDDVLGQMSEAERPGWDWILSNERVTTSQYAEALAVPSRTAKNHIRKLVKLGLLRMRGAGRATEYEVVRS